MSSSLILNSDLRTEPSQSAGDRDRNTYLPRDTEASESRDDEPLKRDPEESVSCFRRPGHAGHVLTTVPLALRITFRHDCTTFW